LFHGDAQALDGISLEIEEGAIVAIVGANGAGKTSLIRTIAGMHVPARGRIFYRGADIAGRPSHQVCELGIGQVAEGRQVFPSLSVAENLAMGAVLARARSARARNLDKVYGLFPVLAERRAQAAGTLSGGEQQMLAMGRALMSRPKLLLMDEPSMGLAPILVQNNFELIQQVNQQGTTIFMVEQNANMALSIANRGYVVQTGRIVLADDAKNLLNNEHLRKAYLGR